MANTHLYKPNLVIVISGPSGSGKSTVIDALCKADETLQLSVSATTRKPRRGEADGVKYHFLSKSDFEKYIQQDRFLESAEYGGNLYGTLKSEIAAARETGKDSILEIEVNGCLEIQERKTNTLLRQEASSSLSSPHHSLSWRNVSAAEKQNRRRN